ncbi:MAG TPA: ribonuclease III [Acidimicrobiia bacterium]
MTLGEILGHEFADPALVEMALTHRSVSAESSGTSDNERLEFLGDAVLQLAVTEKIYNDYPGLAEGELAKVRAAVVSGESLSQVANRVGLGRFLNLSASEERSGGRTKDSILANAMEAIIGAVYLDGGLDVVTGMIYRLWGSTIDDKAESPGRLDFKTRLQEVLATQGKRPSYEVSGVGPDHDRVFTAMVFVDGTVLGSGQGPSKKASEQIAAQQALETLK